MTRIRTPILVGLLAGLVFFVVLTSASESGCPYEHKWKKAEEKERKKVMEDNPDPSSMECDLNGIWLNPRGMQLRISEGVHKEQLVGTITVSSADVYGRYHVYGSYLKDSCMLSFSASWTNDLSGNSKSITSWTGQMMDGALHMTHTTVSHTPVKFAAWLQYINGYDVFVRQSPNSGNKETKKQAK